ncbi:MAG: Zn-ribbon domain-containing OB-fold protein [Pseudomonadota bacterium]
MSAERDYSRLLTVGFNKPMPYQWSIGKYGSRFFQEIKEHKRFIGIRCPKCGKVYTPPRRLCGPCFEELFELVELTDLGTIRAFSTVNYPFIDPNTGRQRPIPYTYGYIQMDGSDTILSHVINEVDVGRIKVGLKARAVFKEPGEMKGDFNDVKYFEIIR